MPGYTIVYISAPLPYNLIIATVKEQKKLKYDIYHKIQNALKSVHNDAALSFSDISGFLTGSCSYFV